MRTIFWDVDTQVDFMMPDGKLYVPGAERLLSNLAALTEYARREGVRIVASADAHELHHRELTPPPDFRSTFPPHCLRGTPGAEKVPATAPRNPLVIESRPYPPDELAESVRRHTGEIVLLKEEFDVFTNPNVGVVLDTLAPEAVVVYGVALDVCDRYAVEGLLARGGLAIAVVEDAVAPIRADEGARLLEAWRERGVRIVSTADVLAGRAFAGYAERQRAARPA
ncbi:MAG TPA: isochorismatase family protein [Thermodesulfobacteriota bacterium]